MRTGRPRAPFVLVEEEYEQLQAIVNSRSLPHGIVTRARIVLMAADRIANITIGEKVGPGLHDELRRG